MPRLPEVGPPDLLTHEEVVALAQHIEAGAWARRHLALADPGLSTARRAMLEQLAIRGQEARHRLIERNLRLVTAVARRYLGRGLSLHDLVQEGSIGLHLGVERYDWRRGCRFSTYVHWWITHAIRRALADQTRLIRLPSTVTALLTRLGRAEDLLRSSLGREPSTNELAQHLGLCPAQIRAAYLAARPLVSLDARTHEGSGDTYADRIADEVFPPVLAAVEAADLSERVEQALERLRPREQQVLRLRFGLDHSRRERSSREIAEELGVSAERVRQIEAQALQRLRQDPLVWRDLSGYVGWGTRGTLPRVLLAYAEARQEA